MGIGLDEKPRFIAFKGGSIAHDEGVASVAKARFAAQAREKQPFAHSRDGKVFGAEK